MPRVLANRYRVGDLIGAGGMAQVYRGFDANLGRPVAVKTMKPELAVRPGFVKQFEQEARSAARLNDPRIVSVYDWGIDRMDCFIIMELVDGFDVRSMMRHQGELDPRAGARIAQQVCQALDLAHGYGIVHSDVKPSNIMFTRTGMVKMADFGIVQMGRESAGTRGAVGTARYMSPEQALGRPLDRRSDVYSLGVTLYEMCGGIKRSREYARQAAADGPTDGGAIGDGASLGNGGITVGGDDDATIGPTGAGSSNVGVTGGSPSSGSPSAVAPSGLGPSVLSGNGDAAWTYVPLSKMNPLIDEDFDRLVENCLSENPKDRYPTAGKFGEALQAYLNGHEAGDEELLGSWEPQFWALAFLTDDAREANRVRLDGPTVIGRSSKADLQIPSRSVSGMHVRLEPKGGFIIAEDLGSSNGTYLNGFPIHRRVYCLPGDVLKVGQTHFKIGCKH